MEYRIIIIALTFLFPSKDFYAQAFSDAELQFKDGYDALLSGNTEKALRIFEIEIFENENYDAVPYYRTAYCASSEENSPSQKKINKAAKLARKAGNYWGASQTKKDFKKAMPLIREKANKGNAIAQYTLGAAYYFGIALKKNHDLAFEYLKLASDQGLSCAKFGLGTLYAEGQGVEKNLEKGIALIEESIQSSSRKFQTKYLKKLKKRASKQKK